MPARKTIGDLEKAVNDCLGLVKGSQCIDATVLPVFEPGDGDHPAFLPPPYLFSWIYPSSLTCSLIIWLIDTFNSTPSFSWDFVALQNFPQMWSSRTDHCLSCEEWSEREGDVGFSVVCPAGKEHCPRHGWEICSSPPLKCSLDI